MPPPLAAGIAVASGTCIRTRHRPRRLLHRHEPHACGRCPKLVQFDSLLTSASQVAVKPRVVRLEMPGEPLRELRGEIGEARGFAAQVKRICEQVADRTRGSVAEYWRQATLGEAALILGQAPAAAHHYADAMALAKGRYGDLSTTRRQARLLARMAMTHASQRR